jgi:hypothetical protein
MLHFMLHGAAVRQWNQLKFMGIACDKLQHEKAIHDVSGEL